jgi:broad-specificity NMP kinase
MKNYQLYFISGVSGVGKSSTMKHLKEMLPVDEFDVRDFDERGVPDGGGREWHDEETLCWFDIAAENAVSGKSTIVCGFANPDRVMDLRRPDHIPVQIILLHASPETIRARLLKRESTPERIKEIERAAGKPLEQFIEDCSTFAATLKEIFEKHGYPIIKTDNKDTEEISKELVRIITYGPQDSHH